MAVAWNNSREEMKFQWILWLDCKGPDTLKGFRDLGIGEPAVSNNQENLTFLK